VSAAPLKIAFAGTPAFAEEALRAIIEAGFEVPLVLTQPDRRAGRGMKRVPSDVKQLALEHGIAVDQPEKLNTAEQREALQQCAPDVLVVAAYGLILPREALCIPRYGCINIHASLLPRWRGAAPIHRAIEAGDEHTGVTIMQMDEGLDTGDMLLRESVPIASDDTTATLHDKLARLGGEMIVDALLGLAQGPLDATPQPAEGVTYAAKVSKAEAVLDWQLPAHVLERKVRAFDPFPGAQGVMRETSLKLWRAVAEPAGEHAAVPGTILSADHDGVRVACGDGVLCFQMLQRPGSRRMPAREFLQGFPMRPGEKFAASASSDAA